MSNTTIATTTNSRPWWRWPLRRWPTALALAMAGLTFGGTATVEGMESFAHILGLLPLLYLVVAKLEKRRATWPLLVAGFVMVFGLRWLELIPMAAVWWGIAGIVLVWSAVDGHFARSGTFRVQALGMLIFGGLGLLGLIVDPQLARYLIAAGWLLHGAWDFVHLKLNKVVARSFAEWCGIVDIVIAIELVLQL